MSSITLMPEDRRAIEQSIESHLDQAHCLIAFLDVVDGDPDIEPSHSEDDAILPPRMTGASRTHAGAGCLISDPDYGVDEEGDI